MRLYLPAFLALLLAACSEDLLAQLADGAPPDASHTADAARACVAGEVSLLQTIHDSAGPIAGVDVCVPTHPALGCRESDSQGQVTLCLPADTDVALSYDAADAGYMRSLLGIHIPAEAPTAERYRDIELKPFETACPTWTAFGVTCPPVTEGLVWVREGANQPEVAGYPNSLGDVSFTFSSTPTNGPVYLDAAFNPDPTLTATSIGAGSAMAAGFPAGDDLIVTASHPTLGACGAFDLFWAGPTPGTVRVPVRVGFRTFVFVTCE